MYFEDSCPKKPSPVGAEGPDMASELGYKVGYSVIFLLEGPGPRVRFSEVGLPGGSLGSSLLSSEYSG